MGRQELSKRSRKPLRLVALGLFAVLLMAGSAYANVEKLSLVVTQEWVDAEHEGEAKDLAVTVSINVQCGNGDGDSGSHGNGNNNNDDQTLHVSTVLHTPDNKYFKDSTSVKAKCGQNSVYFTLHDSQTASGWYTITTTAKMGGLKVTESHSFDPNSEGSMGPL